MLGLDIENLEAFLRSTFCSAEMPAPAILDIDR